ncbi:MAG: DUF167 domain-containing protein [Acetobacterales bacterium]
MAGVPLDPDAAFVPVKEGVMLAVRVTPRAARERIEGLAADAGGHVALKLAVTAPPEDGKANAAIVKLLAKALKLPKSALSVTAGAADRRKTILLAGDPGRLTAALRDWIAGTGRRAA